MQPLTIVVVMMMAMAIGSSGGWADSAGNSIGSSGGWADSAVNYSGIDSKEV